MIKIVWHCEDTLLSFTIENNRNPQGKEVKGTKTGLENLKKRLDIMSNKYELIIDQQVESLYKIELKLWGMCSNA
jgi:LytS/YehU family sensor histidine kinase